MPVINGIQVRYGRGPNRDRWTVTSMDPDRWDVPGGTLAAARERVTEFLSAGGQTR